MKPGGIIQSSLRLSLPLMIVSMLSVAWAHAARSSSDCVGAEFISSLYEPSAQEIRVEKQLAEMSAAVFSADSDRASQVQLISKVVQDIERVAEAEYPTKNQVLSSLRNLERDLDVGGLESYLQRPYEPGEVIPLFRRNRHAAGDESEIRQTRDYQALLKTGALPMIQRMAIEKGRANRLTRESLSRFPANEPVAFVVSANGQLVSGENHTSVGFMLDQRSAGEVLVETRADPKTGEPVLQKVLLSMKSGSYRIGETLFGFRAAIRAFLDQGLVPEQGFVLKDFGGEGLTNQRTLLVVKPTQYGY